ncbi:MAG: hypothetical protein HYU36_06145 [Planctomycetes bacterium]|nr:hypothetical protein [Planctomycetota bacterium]
MPADAPPILREVERRVQPLEKALAIAHWNLETTGDDRYVQESEALRVKVAEQYADRNVFKKLGALRVKPPPQPSTEAERQIDVLYRHCASHQMSPATIEELARRSVQLEACFNRFRALLAGRRVADNEIDQCLANETSSGRVEAAWRASKDIVHFRGEEDRLPPVHQQIRELVQVRNRGAREVGFHDYYQMSMELDELGLDWLFQTLGVLADASEEPFRKYKEGLDSSLARKFGCRVEDLRPWHYGDRFFQSPPKAGKLDLDPLFQGRDVVALTTRTFDGLGLDIRPILARSDLYPGDPATSKKCQHAFCTAIEPPGDVRILCNIMDNERWMSTTLHEFGHGVDSAGLSPDLPYFLKTHAHTLTTEAIALMMERHRFHASWLVEVAGVPAERARDIEARGRAELAAKHIVFTRWVLVMCHFERALYERPEDPGLDGYWWDLVERYQGVARPAPGHRQPDWASKIHLAGAPAYYQNYLLGEVFGAQLEEAIESRFGPLALNPKAGEFLAREMFAHGARWPWRELLRRLTGRDLTLEPFVARGRSV